MPAERECGPDDALLRLLDPDPRRAEERYRQLRLKLVKFFEWRGCPAAEDLTDETIFRVVRRLAQGLAVERAEQPALFVRGVASNVFSEWARSRSRAPDRLDADPPDPRQSEDASATAACRRSCLARLAPETRELLEAYFLDRDRDVLAGRLGLTPNALRIRICRVKADLRSCIEGCLAGSPRAVKQTSGV
jgi:DNA-directed RNA polymerase specialized sigma24 family protein